MQLCFVYLLTCRCLELEVSFLFPVFIHDKQVIKKNATYSLSLEAYGDILFKTSKPSKNIHLKLLKASCGIVQVVFILLYTQYFQTLVSARELLHSTYPVQCSMMHTPQSVCITSAFNITFRSIYLCICVSIYTHTHTHTHTHIYIYTQRERCLLFIFSKTVYVTNCICECCISDKLMLKDVTFSVDCSTLHEDTNHTFLTKKEKKTSLFEIQF